MEREDFVAAGIDYDKGVARFAGKADLYVNFLRKFPKDDTFAQLSAAMDAGDMTAAFAAAHTLKGVTGNLSLDGLYQSVLPLVEALRGAGNMELAASLFPPVKTEYEHTMDFLRTLPE